jgi:hypothetical protein
MPVGGYLPDDVSIRLLLESIRLGGDGRPVTDEDFENLKDPARVDAIVKRLAAQGASDVTRFRSYGTVLPAAVTRRKPRA